MKVKVNTPIVNMLNEWMLRDDDEDYDDDIVKEGMLLFSHAFNNKNVLGGDEDHQ